MSRARRRSPPENIRILRDRSASFSSANSLLESLKRPDMAKRHLQYLHRHESVPRRTVEWLESLSPEQRVKLRLATNSTVDRLVALTQDWTRFKGRRHLLTGTFMVLPQIGRPMPEMISFLGQGEPSGTSHHMFKTREFQGLEDVALVFEGCAAKRKRISGNDYMLYSPIGRVTILEGVFQDGWWYENSHHPDVICPRGGARRIRRLNSRSWFGPIVRSSFKLRSLDSKIIPPMGDEANTEQKCSLYVRWDVLQSRFGVLVELPEQRHPTGNEVLLLPARKEEPIKKSIVLGRELRVALRQMVESRTKEFIFSPKSLADMHDQELAMGFHVIGGQEHAITEQVRDLVSLTTDWIYMQSGVTYTIDDWHRTYLRLCDALGVPRRGKGSS
jgi:hypothetical protein